MPSDRSVWPHLAEPSDIVECAGLLVSRSELPILIRRSIRSDNPTGSKFLVKGYEGTGFSGIDGEVSTASASPSVPQGESVWEMGVMLAMKKTLRTIKRQGNQDDVKC